MHIRTHVRTYIHVVPVDIAQSSKCTEVVNHVHIFYAQSNVHWRAQVLVVCVDLSPKGQQGIDKVLFLVL